jgi:acetoin utilization deacetylase AcuC-like enzyme
MQRYPSENALDFFFDTRQLKHRPTQYFSVGRMIAPVENPNRLETMAGALVAEGLTRRPIPDAGLVPIAAVHDGGYLDFLATAHERFTSLPNAGPEVLPNVHPYAAANATYEGRPRRKVTGIVGLAGWYMGDMSCAITAGTWEAAYWSAQTAVAAADAVIAGATASFALCRPPGHHAYADRASGFCFLNNAAIAAERLRTRFERVAILDFDTHHGDGTQAIFYRRGDVFFGSVHTDPANYYPWFMGYADEAGAGEGDGATLNLPLPPGTGDEDYVAAVAHLIEAARHFGAEALVVSAGWDAHRDDPLSKLAVTSAAYPRLGAALGALCLPTVVVQEGGYSLAAIAEAAPAFTRALLDACGE